MKKRMTRSTLGTSDKPAPRLPHERDESSESQKGPAHESMQQAYRDLQRGLIDTEARNDTLEIADAKLADRVPASEPARRTRKRVAKSR